MLIAAIGTKTAVDIEKMIEDKYVEFDMHIDDGSITIQVNKKR
jgi:hypothetical protein